MAKKVYTLEDLVQFCSVNNFTKFDVSENGNPLLVRVPASFEKNETEDSSTLYASIKLLHTGTNRNRSNVTEEAAKKCLNSIKYKPLLANFCEFEDENGELVKDFTSHDMIINDDGTVEYLERQIGCFTADKPYIEKEEDGRSFIYATVAIPREYSDAAAIIERKGGTKVSAELLVNKMSYDIKTSELMLEDIEVMGCTCLGSRVNADGSVEEVQEGMRGARLDINSFSADEKIFDMMQKLTDAFETYTKFTRKEETEVDPIMEENFEEVTELEEVTEETTEDEVTTEEEFSEEETEVTPEEDVTEDFTEDETEEVEEFEEEETVEDDGLVKCSVTIGEKIREFSVSMSDKMAALNELVNDTYADDMTWYSTDVYDDDGYVVMVDCWSGKAYRQNYKVKKNTYSLVGDRIAVHSVWMTDDEQTKFDKLKADFEVISDKLSKYESEPQKMEILNSDDYSQIAESDDFKAFKEQDAHFDMSVDEVKAKADEMLLEFAKHNSLKFSTKEKSVGHKSLFSIKSGSSRYGDIFSK